MQAYQQLLGERREYATYPSSWRACVGVRLVRAGVARTVENG